MHQDQFERLRRELGVGDYGDVPHEPRVMMHIQSGRQKGRVGRIITIQGTKLIVQVDGGGRPLTFHYSKLDRVDRHGEPLPNVAHDGTGRPILGTEVIAYSVGDGPFHALEIGRVLRTNPSGTLLVQPYIQDGKRIAALDSDLRRDRVKPQRVIILPVDAGLVTTWLLSGFAVFKANTLLDD